VAGIQDIARGFNAVKTVAQARIAIGETLNALGRAYQLPGITSAQRGTLDGVRAKAEAWFRVLRSDTDHAPVTNWRDIRRDLERAYIEIAGVGGTIEARRTVSLGDELLTSTRDVAQGIGRGVGAVATTVGDTAGTLIGGLLSGLGPVVVVVLAIVVFVYFRGKLAK